MNFKHRKIDFSIDKEYILERHCRVNYECDCYWKRADFSLPMFKTFMLKNHPVNWALLCI